MAGWAARSGKAGKLLSGKWVADEEVNVDDEVDVDKVDVRVDDEMDNKDAPEQSKTNSLLPRVRSKKAGGWWKVGCRA